MSATIPFTIEARAGDTLGTLLSPIHDRWIEQVGVLLSPAMVPQADLWERWGAVRYLIDRFEDRFRMECALVDSLTGRLSRTAVVQLNNIRTCIERTRRDLITLGRRRGTAMVVSAFTENIFDQAKLWCAELEFATSKLRWTELPAKTQCLVEHLEMAASLDL
jgi:hypothetical protein